MALFGKAGAELLPTFKELAQEQQANIRLTNDQIAAADKFTDDMAALRSELATLGKVVVSDILPPFQAFLDAIKGAEGTATAFGAAGNVIVTIFETLSIVLANVVFVFKGVGREIAAIAAQLVALSTLDIDGFNAISEAVKEDGVRARKELDDFERRILTARERARQQTQALSLLGGRTGAFDANDARAKRPRLRFTEDGEDDKKGQAFLDRLRKQATTLEQNEFASLRIEAAQLKVAAAAEPWIKRLEQAKGLQESIRLFTEDAARAEKERFEAGDLQVNLSKQLQDLEFEASLIGKNREEVERLTQARRVDLAAQDALRGKEFAEISQILSLYDDFAERIDAVVKARQAATRGNELRLLSLEFDQELQDIQFATSLIGKTREEVEKLTAARQVDRREAQATLGLEGAALDETAEAYKRFRSQVLGSIEEQQRIQRELAPLINTAEQFGETISSAFEEAIIEGKRFGDVLKSLAQDLTRILLRNFVTNPLADAITGALRGISFGGSSGGGFAPGEAPGSFTGSAIQSARTEPAFTKAAGAGASPVVINVDARGATDPSGIDRAARALREQVKADRAEDRARNPALA